MGGRVVRQGHLYAISVRDLPATVSQRHCGVSRIVKRNSLSIARTHAHVT
jgi:hypothetical protein